MVRGDHKLLDDDDGEILKSQGKSWRVESRLLNLLFTRQKTCQVVNCLLCSSAGMLAFRLKRIIYIFIEKKNKKQKKTICQVFATGFYS